MNGAVYGSLAGCVSPDDSLTDCDALPGLDFVANDDRNVNTALLTSNVGQEEKSLPFSN